MFLFKMFCGIYDLTTQNHKKERHDLRMIDLFPIFFDRQSLVKSKDQSRSLERFSSGESQQKAHKNKKIVTPWAFRKFI